MGVFRCWSTRPRRPAARYFATLHSLKDLVSTLHFGDWALVQ